MKSSFFNKKQKNEKFTFVHLHFAESAKIEFQLNGDGRNDAWPFSKFNEKWRKLRENLHFQPKNGESEEATFVHLHLAESEKIEFQLNGDGENESWKFSIFKPKMEKSEKISTFNK